MFDKKRAVELLEATRKYLHALDETPAADPLAITVHYDGTDCDGCCLLDDIELFLEDVYFNEK